MDGGEAGERLGPLDVVAYSTSSRGVTVNLLDGTATGQGQDTFVNIGGVIGSSFDDIITGDADSNLILGLEGSDAIDAGVGDDLVDGDDHVSANFSIGLPFDAFGCQTVCDDVIGGGEGNDALAGAVGVDLVQGGPGMDTLIGGAGRFGCCNLDASDDIVLGGDGNDDIYGGNFDLMNGHQVSRPHDGDDVLQGDGGDDSLFGQADGDTLDGGPGSNANNGGPGADSCVNPDTVGGATNCESR
jgi:Ca2+-binding RTX toxin-like protein